MKSLYTLDRRLGGPKTILEALVKISIPASFKQKTMVVQPITGYLTNSCHMILKCNNFHG
jgi:hypothetical protein